MIGSLPLYITQVSPEKQALAPQLAESLAGIPSVLGLAVGRSWSTDQTPTALGLYFLGTGVVIDPPLLAELQQRASVVSQQEFAYFASGAVITAFWGKELGVMTDEAWVFTNGSKENISNPHRKSLGSLDPNGRYHGCRVRLIDINPANGGNFLMELLINQGSGMFR